LAIGQAAYWFALIGFSPEPESAPVAGRLKLFSL